MQRRAFLKQTAFAAGGSAALRYGGGPSAVAAPASTVPAAAGEALRRHWLARWEANIAGNARSRYCDRETGEELGWLVSPFLNGFYYGYLATRDLKWIKHFLDWTDACIKRAVYEPDDFPGWPKGDGAGGESKDFKADSLVGEAMLLRPIVLMAQEIASTPALAVQWGTRAQAYLALAETMFQKWDTRECWRETGNGGLWVVPSWGIDLQTGKWSGGYGERKTAGFSNPHNKENEIARWMLALFDATQKPIYRDRAVKWFQLMKYRMQIREEGKYFVWNYWEPAGPWDYRQDGSPKHWVGVHPNGGYYGSDIKGIVAAFEHGLVFGKEDIGRLIATNRDFMWNQKVAGAKFQRIDGGQPDPRWAKSPGMLWTALVPYDAVLREVFAANHDPSGWDGLETAPWFLAQGRA
ncbi:MAG: hypothetical protein ACLPPF_12750 [Rhodomicrobium sp.]